MARAADPEFAAELVFPSQPTHNHAPGIVELPDGGLYASWYRGSGERSADDVAVYGAWRRPGESSWSDPVVIADTPGFPDCNTCLMLDHQQRLWLFWPTILANSWESALTNFKVAKEIGDGGVPRWDRQGVVLLKPMDLEQQILRRVDEEVAADPRLLERASAELETLRGQVGNRLLQRLGWQPRCKPLLLPSGRILLPLYSDTFSISIMAISDDDGQSWRASQPLIGFGNIQPSLIRRDDGTLVAFMRENGGRGRVRSSESRDDGEGWSPVVSTDLPNPGSGLDGVRLANGHWVLVYNDSTEQRSTLAVSLSEDEGRTWGTTRHLEQNASGSYHYPAVIQGKDGMLHVIYSHFTDDGKTMKHAAFNEAWIIAGD